MRERETIRAILCNFCKFHIVRVVGIDGLRLSAFSKTVLRFFALKMKVLRFFSLSERFADILDKYGSRSQISTKIEIKLRIFFQYDMILGEHLQLLTFSTGTKALQLAVSFWVSKMTRRQSSAA